MERDINIQANGIIYSIYNVDVCIGEELRRIIRGGEEDWKSRISFFGFDPQQSEKY